MSDFDSANSSAVLAISGLSDTTKRTASEEGTRMFPPTHPTAKTLPWFARPRSPNTLTDPLPLAYLHFEPFAWQLNLDVIVLTLALK